MKIELKITITRETNNSSRVYFEKTGTGSDPMEDLSDFIETVIRESVAIVLKGKIIDIGPQ